MKHTLLLSGALLLCGASFAQQRKTTGGCGYQCSITDITPCAAPGVLYKGGAYTVSVGVSVTGCEPIFGKIEVRIAGIVVGQNPNGDAESPESLIIPLDKITVPPAVYTMEVTFDDRFCGSRTAYRQVTIQEAPKIDSIIVTTEDTIAKTPQQVPEIKTRAELVAYPVPASGSIYIDGLRGTETGYELHITNEHGREIVIPGISRSNSTITIPANELPSGIYFVQLRTAERNFNRKVEVQR